MRGGGLRKTEKPANSALDLRACGAERVCLGVGVSHRPQLVEGVPYGVKHRLREEHKITKDPDDRKGTEAYTLTLFGGLVYDLILLGPDNGGVLGEDLGLSLWHVDGHESPAVCKVQIELVAVTDAFGVRGSLDDAVGLLARQRDASEGDEV